MRAATNPATPRNPTPADYTAASIRRPCRAFLAPCRAHAPRRPGFHLHHPADRRAGLRRHHSGTAGAGARFHRRRFRRGGEVGRLVRFPVRRAAVRQLTTAGGAVRPLRPSPGDPGLVPGPGRGLRGDGAGAEPAVAAAGAGGVGRVLGQLHHRQRLHRRHHHAGQARPGLRHDRRRVRARFRDRAAARRLARQLPPARAVLVRRRAGAAQFPVRPVGAARIAGAGTAHPAPGLDTPIRSARCGCCAATRRCSRWPR